MNADEEHLKQLVECIRDRLNLSNGELLFSLGHVGKIFFFYSFLIKVKTFLRVQNLMEMIER